MDTERTADEDRALLMRQRDLLLKEMNALQNKAEGLEMGILLAFGDAAMKHLRP